jgi:hypothetical protein
MSGDGFRRISSRQLDRSSIGEEDVGFEARIIEETASCQNMTYLDLLAAMLIRRDRAFSPSLIDVPADIGACGLLLLSPACAS